jgi:hypothetical protein
LITSRPLAVNWYEYSVLSGREPSITIMFAVSSADYLSPLTEAADPSFE